MEYYQKKPSLLTYSMDFLRRISRPCNDQIPWIKPTTFSFRNQKYPFRDYLLQGMSLKLFYLRSNLIGQDTRPTFDIVTVVWPL